MTVQNTNTKNIYVGNDSTTVFPFTFYTLSEHPEYIKVYITGAGGVDVLTENYTIDMQAQNVTYPKNGSPLKQGEKITIARELPLLQDLNLVNQGPFFAEEIEKVFDEFIMIAQQLSEKTNRSLKIKLSTEEFGFDVTVPIAAGKSFRVSDDGKKLEVTEDPAKVMPIVEGLLEETKTVKAEAIEETTAIKNSAVTETTNIKNQMVKEAEEIKDAAVKETTQIADAASSSAWLASQKASEAITSANSALGSKNEASNSAELAEKWAQGSESPDGSAGSKSSKSWAMEAGQRATAANLSANSASQSANAAQGSEETASSKAAAASNSANAAKQSELKAKQYKDEAFAGTPEGYAELVERVNNMGHFSVVNGALCINYEKEDDIL